MLWQFGKRVVYVLGASIFVTVSVMAVWSRENAVEFAEIGSCVTADTLGYGASGRQANCDDPDALYVVATKPNRSSDCPASGYASFVLNQAKSTRVYMCLAPNLEVGRCYADVGATTSVIDEVACPRPLGEPPIDQLAQETGEGPDLPSEDPYSDDSYGDDSYNGTIMGLGFAWDDAVGGLIDFAGNDRYEATGGGTQGNGAQAGLGFLFDYRGDDVYLGYGQGNASPSISYHDLPQCGGNFSFVVDYGGKDQYGCGVRNDSYNRRGSNGGFVIDRPSREEQQETAETTSRQPVAGS